MLSSIAKPFAALALATALISIVLAALGASPIGVFAALGEGAFGNWYACVDTIVKSCPLIFTGLAVSLAFSGALWNIGADGQLTIGAIAAGAIGTHLSDFPHSIAVAIILAAGALGGAVWGGIAGWLRARRDVNEVISTIMLNFVAVQMLSWMVHGPLMEPSRAYPTSSPIASAAQLEFYFAPSRLNLGMLLAVVLAGACYMLLFNTSAGFELRAMGRNRRAATFFGIRIPALTVWVMALSGALAGLGGAVQVSAISHRLYEKLSPGWGFEAIAVALVARLNPLAIVPAALLFGALDNGSQAMQRTQGISPELVQVIQALVILIILAFDTPAWSGLRENIFGPSGDDAATVPPVAEIPGMLEAFLVSVITMATPILLAALGELLVEESGVVNIGIEGAMLSGAFAALMIAFFSGSDGLGLMGAIAAGVAINAIFAVLVVNLAVNQVVTGTAVSILALGLTGVFYRKLFGVTGKAFMVAPIAKIPLGPLARIPLLGPVLFNHNALVYFTFILVPALWYVIAHTRYGLRLRACGERPEAADALGLGVIAIRWQALLVSGALTGLAGAFLTLAYANTFVENISAGRGFVALSVVIVGRWNSWGLAAASLLFGAAMALQFGLQALGTVLPYQLFLALPYALTLAVLAGFGGQAAAPSALGEPYRRQ